MCEFIKYAGGIIFGAAVGCGFGLGSFWLQRRWIARGDFHAAIDDQIAKLDAIDRTNNLSKPLQTAAVEDLFLEESIPILITAARRVRRHISAEEWQNLQTALEEYKTYQKEHKGIDGRCLMAVKGDPTFSQALHAHLEKIDRCISNNPIA
jgi:uncharacterized alpha-E superfamily protein